MSIKYRLSAFLATIYDFVALQLMSGKEKLDLNLTFKYLFSSSNRVITPLRNFF